MPLIKILFFPALLCTDHTSFYSYSSSLSVISRQEKQEQPKRKFCKSLLFCGMYVLIFRQHSSFRLLHKLESVLLCEKEDYFIK